MHSYKDAEGAAQLDNLRATMRRTKATSPATNSANWSRNHWSRYSRVQRGLEVWRIPGWISLAPTMRSRVFTETPRYFAVSILLNVWHPTSPEPGDGAGRLGICLQFSCISCVSSMLMTMLLLSIPAAEQNSCTVLAVEERDTTGDKMPLKARIGEIERFSRPPMLKTFKH